MDNEKKYIYMEYYSAVKKIEIMRFEDKRMKLEILY